MKNLVLVAAVAGVLAAPTLHAQAARGAGPAVTAEQIGAMQAQLDALAEQLKKVNAELAAAKSRLDKQSHVMVETDKDVGRLKAETGKKIEEIAKKGAGPEWLNRFTFRGELKVRYEMLESDDDRAVAGTPAADFPIVDTIDRTRERIRFRFGGTYKVNDTTTVGMQLATGGDDPRRPLQTFTDVFTRKSFALDQAYASWQPTKDWQVRLGKMPQPWFRPGSSMFFDNDLHPEGAAVNWTRGKLFAGASYTRLLERGPTVLVAGQGRVDPADPGMGHLQFGFKHPFSETTSVTAGVSYYDHFAVQGRSPFYNGNPYGNSTVTVAFPAGTRVLRYDYDVMQAFAQFDTTFGKLPFVAYLDLAQNRDAELDTAWSVGFTLGKAGAPGTWDLGLLYQLVEKDALFAQWIDSAHGEGTSDTKGWVLRGTYAPAKNVTLNAIWYQHELNNDSFGPAAPRDRELSRLRLDANFKF